MEPTRERFASLDGLRGVAAVIVVIFHVVVSDPRAGAIYALTNGEPATGVEWLFNYTPLRILWSGSEAVVLFYVLSGFVLALPFARGRTQQWRYFYPRRLLRLYIPAIVSLVFAWLTTLIIHRAAIPGGSPWLNGHAEEGHGPLQVVLGSSLIAGWGSLNTSLWSLRWEVIFSLLLPVFLFLASWFTRGLWLKVVVVLAFCALWPVFGFFYGDLVYIAVFALGVLLAYTVERVRAVAARIPTAVWWIALFVAITLITNSWLVAGADPYSRVRLAWIGIAALGSVMTVVIVAFWPPAKRLFETRWIRWLGMISFSLYLTQEPIVVGLGFLTRGAWPLWVELPLALALSLLVGWLFYRFVEKPSHRFSRNFLRARQEREATDSPVSTATRRSAVRPSIHTNGEMDDPLTTTT